MSQTALITGASTGIGKELAILHAKAGHDLILVARNEQRLQEVADQLSQQHGITATVLAKDLAVQSAPSELFAEVSERGLQVDYLINNAGFGGVGEFAERPWDEDAAMLQVNIVALTELSRLFLPAMLQRNSGRILNVSSTASLVPGGPNQAVYFATKAYVTSLSYGIAEECHASAVTVTALLPGATATEFGERSGMDKTGLFDKTASAASVAHDGFQGMMAGKLRVVSGLTFAQRLLMKLLPFMPLDLALSQMRQMQSIKE